MKTEIEKLLTDIHAKNEELKLKVIKGFSFDESLPNFAQCQKSRHIGKITVYTSIEKELIKILNNHI